MIVRVKIEHLLMIVNGTKDPIRARAVPPVKFPLRRPEPAGRQRDCCLIETNLPDLFVAGGAGRGPIKRGALWQAGALWPSNLRFNT